MSRKNPQTGRYERELSPYEQQVRDGVRASVEATRRSDGRGPQRSGGWLDKVDQQMTGTYDPRAQAPANDDADTDSGRDPITGRRRDAWAQRMADRMLPDSQPSPVGQYAPNPVEDARRARWRAEQEARDAQQTRSRDGWLGKVDRSLFAGQEAADGIDDFRLPAVGNEPAETADEDVDTEESVRVREAMKARVRRQSEARLAKKLAEIDALYADDTAAEDEEYDDEEDDADDLEDDDAEDDGGDDSAAGSWSGWVADAA